MAGDCYQANGNFIITKMGDNDFKLCHGVALLASDKKPFGHCWIEKGGSGGTTGGGWDRYGSDGQKLGKCGDGKEGGAYAACLSKEKARKLGPDGRASFVRRKRRDQKKAGDTKKGRQKSKGKSPVMSKTGA